MTGGTSHALPVKSGDGSHLIAAGPVQLGTGAAEKVAFAIIGGTGEGALIQSAAAARARYQSMQDNLVVDFLPGICPNVLALSVPVELSQPRPAKAVPGPSWIELAILAQEGLSASDIDPYTATLASLSPVNWRIADVGTPLALRETDCDCPSSNRDGLADLVLGYDRNALIEALGHSEGQHSLEVHVSGKSGAPYLGSECVSLTTGPVKHLTRNGPYSKANLRANTPNPFNASTVVSFNTNIPDHVRLEVFDILGRHIRTLIDQTLSAGDHSVTWDSRDENGTPVASGVYLSVLTISGESYTQKMVLLK